MTGTDLPPVLPEAVEYEELPDRQLSRRGAVAGIGGGILLLALAALVLSSFDWRASSRTAGLFIAGSRVHLSRLTVAVPPLSWPFFRGPLSNPSGYDADVVRTVARDLGIRHVRWIRIPASKLTSPGPRHFDVGVHVIVAPGGSPGVATTQPYFSIYDALVVRRGRASALRSHPEETRRLAIGTATPIDFEPEHKGPLRRFATLERGLRALAAESIDGLIVEAPRLPSIDLLHPSAFEGVGVYPGYRDVVFTVRGRTLREGFDLALSTLDTTGTHTQLILKWFPEAKDLSRLPARSSAR